MSIWEAWVRIPSKAESFSVNFSPIGKITTHPLGSLFDFNRQGEVTRPAVVEKQNVFRDNLTTPGCWGEVY